MWLRYDRAACSGWGSWARSKCNSARSRVTSGVPHDIASPGRTGLHVGCLGLLASPAARPPPAEPASTPRTLEQVLVDRGKRRGDAPTTADVDYH